MSLCVCTCRSVRACRLCSTHLVCIERFDLGSNGIKIPTDIVGEKAGCEDRKERVSDRGRGLRLREETESVRAQIEERRRERTSGHVSAL